jgi:hypothetical protein
MARIKIQSNRKITILKAAGHTVIKCTGKCSSYALSVQTAVEKVKRKMTNNVHWNRKFYFQESDNFVSNKKLNQERSVQEMCTITW